MKKSLKIFALAASLLQAALFSVFAESMLDDFFYDLTDDENAVKITGLKNSSYKTEYVIPTIIEGFPVTEVKINAYFNNSITILEGIIDVDIDGDCTLKQLPSTVKKLHLHNCYYNGTLPAEIENVFLETNQSDIIKLNQNFSELKNLKKLYCVGKNGSPVLDLSGSQIESLTLKDVGIANKTPFEAKNKLCLNNVEFIDNKTLSISKNIIENKDSYIFNTNVEELIFEEGVTEIPYNFVSFEHRDHHEGNYSLKKIVLPSTLTKINSQAFSNCPNISEVVVPDSLGKIETDARGIDQIFNETSLPLRTRLNLKKLFGFSNK